MTLDLAGGLATYLGEAWGEPVAVTDVSMTTAGARRHNVLFTAMVGDEPRRLVATIVPEGETLINPIEAEAGVRELAEQAEVAVPTCISSGATVIWSAARSWSRSTSTARPCLDACCGWSPSTGSASASPASSG